MALTAGSIAFTGYNGDGNDNLSFVALTDIPQGTVINFTDSNWNGTSFASGSNSESAIAWSTCHAPGDRYGRCRDPMPKLPAC